MFIKPFRIKSQTQVKGSERKKIRAELSQAFPTLTTEELSNLLPNKEDVTLIRIYCAKGESVNIYQIQKDPMFFLIDKEKEIYPTVYMLWRFPRLLHAFTTHCHVIGVLAGGADLMLPGIIIKGQLSPYCYGGKFEKGFKVAINTTSNKAPTAVGVTAHSSMDMFMCGRQGKGANILHVYRDQLWEMGSKSLPPELGPPDIMLTSGVAQESTERTSGDTAKEDTAEVTAGVEELRVQEEDEEEEAAGGAESQTVSPSQQQEDPQPTGPEVMDRLLRHCFLKAWKTTGKKVELPILTSNFYRLHMIPSCPDAANLDIKKSSYKKLSKFLNAMAKEELIQVKEFPKGIENITLVNWAHEEYKCFIVDKEETTVKPDTNKSSNNQTFVPPQIEEVIQVSGDTLAFFRSCGFSKGDVLTIAEVRAVVTDYIKRNGLKKEGQNTVNLDTTLHEAVVNRKEGYKEVLRWDEIFSRMLGKMAPAARITRPGYLPIIRKGKLDPIELAVAKRSGNKKVTLVYNVNVYGIDEAEFAHQIQVGVAASTSVGPAEHKPQGTTQVLVQGNQVAFIGKLLLNTYHLPKKYIRGLELAVKTRK